MNTEKYTQLKDLVIKEITLLKANVTEEEKKKIKFRIYPCIYCQLTDDCSNERGIELQKKCCEKVYNADDENPVEFSKAEDYNTPSSLFMDLSVNHTNGNNTAIINFLKNDTQTLELI